MVLRAFGPTSRHGGAFPAVASSAVVIFRAKRTMEARRFFHDLRTTLSGKLVLLYVVLAIPLALSYLTGDSEMFGVVGPHQELQLLRVANVVLLVVTCVSVSAALAMQVANFQDTEPLMHFPGPHRKECVLHAEDTRGETVAVPAAHHRLELPQGSAARVLDVHAELIDDRVVRLQREAALGVDGQQVGLAAGAVEARDAQIHIADRVGPTRGEVRMPASGVGLVDRLVEHRRQPAQTALARRVRALPEEGQHVQIQDAPIPLQREIHHGLAELFLIVDVLDCIALVDDVDQMHRLRRAPEHLANTRHERPAIAQPQRVGLAQVEMGAARVVRVQTQHRAQS